MARSAPAAMKVNQRFTGGLWLLPLVVCGLSLAAQMLSVEHPGFRVAAQVIESVVTFVPPTSEPPTDTPLPPTHTPTPTETPVPAPPANTPVPPTDTPIDTATPLPPSATPSRTPRPPRTRTPMPTSAGTSTPTPTLAPAFAPTSPTPALTPIPDTFGTDSAESAPVVPAASIPSATATPLPAGIKYVVRAEPARPGSQSDWMVHVCVFDQAPALRGPTLTPTPESAPTRTLPVASPIPASRRIVAREIEVVAQAQAAARIVGGWSQSSRAKLTGQELRFHTPALYESEVLLFAFEIETGKPGQAWQVRVRDARGPAIDLSGDARLNCGYSGLLIRSPAAPPATFPPHPIAPILPLALSDRTAALRADAPPHGPSVSANHTQLVIVAVTGMLGLAGLITAAILHRRQRGAREHRLERRLPATRI